MKRNQTFAVMGGDQRNAHLANILAQKNPEDRIYGLFLDPAVKLSGKVCVHNDIRLILPQSDIIIFPLPTLGSDGYINTPVSGARVSLEECVDYIQPGSLILAGKLPPHIPELAMERGIELDDYLNREEFAVLNAVPTALYKMV